MIDTSGGLGFVVSDFLVGAISLDDLDSAVAQLGERPRPDDPALMALWGSLELLLAEYSEGVLPPTELRWELGRLVPTTVALGPRPVVRQVTATASRAVTLWARGLTLGSPSPAVDRAAAAVHA